jgi:hypothetical protein
MRRGSHNTRWGGREKGRGREKNGGTTVEGREGAPDKEQKHR